MNYQVAIWIIFGVTLVIYALMNKKGYARMNIILISILVMLIAIRFLPRQLFGKWNSIHQIENKKVSSVLLEPLENAATFSLVQEKYLIEDTNSINVLLYYLNNVEVYFPSHPTNKWESKLILISGQNDSLSLTINKTDDDGTIIHTETNDWKNDDLGNYLEILVGKSSQLTTLN